jgi:hypothetical protein
VAYFIHLADPSFPEGPWPGERRLGPFNSQKEAAAQAANDIAIGMGESIIGVYSEAESDKRDEAMRSEDAPQAKLAVTREKLDSAAAKIREQNNREVARVIEEQRQLLEQVLPEGVSVDEFLSAVRATNPRTAAKGDQD